MAAFRKGLAAPRSQEMRRARKRAAGCRYWQAKGRRNCRILRIRFAGRPMGNARASLEKAPEIRFAGLQVQDLLVAELAVVEVARSRHRIAQGGIVRAAAGPDGKRRLPRAGLRAFGRMARGHFPARQARAGAFGGRAVRSERGLRPFADNAASRAGNELSRAVADEAHDVRARLGVEAARGKNLRDLLAELAVAPERLLDLLPDGRGEPVAQGHAAWACPCVCLVPRQIRQSAREGALDGVADAAFEVRVGGLLEGGVGRKCRVTCGRGRVNGAGCCRTERRLRRYALRARRGGRGRRRRFGNRGGILERAKAGEDHFAKRSGIFAQQPFGKRGASGGGLLRRAPCPTEVGGVNFVEHASAFRGGAGFRGSARIEFLKRARFFGRSEAGAVSGNFGPGFLDSGPEFARFSAAFGVRHHLREHGRRFGQHSRSWRSGGSGRRSVSDGPNSGGLRCGFSGRNTSPRSVFGGPGRGFRGGARDVGVAVRRDLENLLVAEKKEFAGAVPSRCRRRG